MEYMMEHQKFMELLPAYLDQELGISDLIALEQHLSSCSTCQNEYAELSSAREKLKKHATYFAAPDHLARRISMSLPHSQPDTPSFKGWSLNWMNMGAALVTLLALVWSGALYLTLPSTQDKLVEELISSHVRSLQVDHLSDVVSSDRHTVKPWFNGKLDFSPPVFDLSSQGFPLVGGRLDYLNGRTVAVLVYRHNLHPINVYVWPSTNSEAALKILEHKGYHLVRWTMDGMEYWAVSDLATDELESFVGILRSQV
jgi:anti-sigma factor RsiW